MTDLVTLIYRRLVVLMSQDADWPVASQNFIHYADIQGIQDPEKPVTADGDYPQAMLDGPVSGNSMMAVEDSTFATWATDDQGEPTVHGPGENSNPVDFTEKATYDFRLRLMSQTERLDDYGPLLTKTLRVVRRAGARLGLKQVAGVTFRFTCQLVADPETFIKRWEITLLLSIRTELEETLLDGV